MGIFSAIGRVINVRTMPAVPRASRSSVRAGLAAAAAIAAALAACGEGERVSSVGEGKDGGAEKIVFDDAGQPHLAGNPDAEVVTFYPNETPDAAVPVPAGDAGGGTPPPLPDPVYGVIVMRDSPDSPARSFNPAAAPTQGYMFQLKSWTLTNEGGPVNPGDEYRIFLRTNNHLIDAVAGDTALAGQCLDGVLLTAKNRDDSWVWDPAVPDFRSPQRVNRTQLVDRSANSAGTVDSGPQAPEDDLLSGFDRLPVVGDVSCNPASSEHGSAGHTYWATVPPALYANGQPNAEFSAWIYFNAAAFPNDPDCGGSGTPCYDLLETYIEAGVVKVIP